MHRKNHDFEDITLNPYMKPDVERLKIARNDANELWKSRMISIENWVRYAQHQFFFQKLHRMVEDRHGWDASREASIRTPGDVNIEEIKKIKINHRTR